MPEKMSSIEKVIGKGLSEEEKGLFVRRFKEKFDNQKFEELRGLEREKTAEELEIISLANEKTNELLEKFGLKKFDVPPKNIHIIPGKKWPGKKKESDAFFNADKQAVAMKGDLPKLLFAEKIFHEMLHFKSGTALLVKKEKKGVFSTKTRLGFQIHEKTGGKEYFNNLNEAITEESVKRLVVGLKESPLFRDEIDKMKKMYKEYPQLITGDTLVLEVSLPDAKGEKRYNRWCFAYGQERKILNILIDKLYEKNKDEFKYREEVFNLFAKAMLEGNIIEVGHLVDTTFGKGTMRVIGELEDDINGQENYVKML